MRVAYTMSFLFFVCSVFCDLSTFDVLAFLGTNGYDIEEVWQYMIHQNDKTCSTDKKRNNEMYDLFFKVFLYMDSRPNWLPLSMLEASLEQAELLDYPLPPADYNGDTIREKVEAFMAPRDGGNCRHQTLHKGILFKRMGDGAENTADATELGSTTQVRVPSRSSYPNNHPSSVSDADACFFLFQLFLIVSAAVSLGLCIPRIKDNTHDLSRIHHNELCKFKIVSRNNVVRNRRNLSFRKSDDPEHYFNQFTGLFDPEAFSNYCEVEQLGLEEAGSPECIALSQRFQTLEKQKNYYVAGIALGSVAVFLAIFNWRLKKYVDS